MEYYSKYIKYKNKYLLLKNNKVYIGGAKNILNVNKMKKYLKNINKYKIFKINYSKNELDAINNYDIYKNDHYRFFGKNTEFNPEQFLSDYSNLPKESQIISDFLKKLTLEVTNAYNLDYVWIDIRFRLPTNEYDIPRWHQDGMFFKKDNYTHTKFLLVLKGEGTLLVDLKKDKQKEFNEIYEKFINDKKNVFEKYNDTKNPNFQQELKNIMNTERPVFHELLKNENIIQLKNNESLIFIAGDENLATIHSEPAIKSKRIFFSIVPGTKEDIKDLQKRRE